MLITNPATETTFCLSDLSVVVKGKNLTLMYNKRNPSISYTGTFNGFINQYPELALQVLELECLVPCCVEGLKKTSYSRLGVNVEVSYLKSPSVIACIASDEPLMCYVGENEDVIKLSPYRSFKDVTFN